jgi:hypothetical protein
VQNAGSHAPRATATPLALGREFPGRTGTSAIQCEQSEVAIYEEEEACLESEAKKETASKFGVLSAR